MRALREESSWESKVLNLRLHNWFTSTATFATTEQLDNCAACATDVKKKKKEHIACSCSGGANNNNRTENHAEKLQPRNYLDL